MIAIRAAEAEGEHDRERIEHDVFSERFLIKRPLLQALEPDPAGAPVLLIDELDRSDEAFEAFLLEVLADFQVTIPELGTIKAEHPPIVVITSNRTREIHDALKRRCLYHWVGYPTAARELEIVRAKVPGVGKKLSEQVVGFVQALRKQDLFKSPGVAETLDWATGAVRARRGRARSGDRVRHARRAAEIPGRHRAARRRQGQGTARPGAGGAARGGVSAHEHGEQTPKAASPKTSSTSRARCARPAFRSGRARCSMRSPRCARPASARKDDFYWTLHAVFVKRHEHSVLFDQAFQIFFRKRGYLERLIAMMSPEMTGAPAAAPRSRRPRSACSTRCSRAPRRSSARSRRSSSTRA